MKNRNKKKIGASSNERSFIFDIKASFIKIQLHSSLHVQEVDRNS